MVKPKKPNRTRSMVGLSAGLIGNYLSYQLQRPFSSAGSSQKRKQEMDAKSARQVREELQNLRGPLMKVGQALSMQTHALSSAWIKELSNLQMQAPPMHYSLMRAQFKNSLGKFPEEVFKTFESKPFAAASLGQVHWAVTKEGRQVAVKIQYPAVREAIEEDFGMLKTFGLPARLTGHLGDKLIAEAQRGILEETDYLREARNIEYFRAALTPLPFIHIPQVFPALSGDRVLTMSRVTGVRMGEFMESSPSQELRDRIGEALVRLFFFQVFRVGALHADPHPGNYLFNQDGTVSLVDFGCVKYLKPEVSRCYGDVWARQWAKDAEVYARVVTVMLGAKRVNDPKVRKIMFDLKKFYDEFHPMDKPGFVSEPGSDRFMEGIGELAKILLQNKFLLPDFLFISRTESGLCNILHTLKARVKTTTIVKELMLHKP